jgi:hypothetical protein
MLERKQEKEQSKIRFENFKQSQAAGAEDKVRRLDTTSTEQRGKQSREGQRNKHTGDERSQEILEATAALELNTQAFLNDVKRLFEANNARPETSHLETIKYVFATAIEDIGNEYPLPYSRTDFQVNWKMYKYLK